MDVDVTAFALSALAVWRITHLVALEDGPFDVVVKVRSRVGQGVVGHLLDCFLCLSLWVAAPFAVVVAASWIDRAVVWLALSGAASLLFLSTDGRARK